MMPERSVPGHASLTLDALAMETLTSIMADETMIVIVIRVSNVLETLLFNPLIPNCRERSVIAALLREINVKKK